MRIAVLALQGAFAEHRQKLAQLGVDSFEVRQLKDWDQPKDGLIIPGGESTTQAKLLNELGLMEPVKEAIAAGLPVYGTCAGLILLAKKIEGEPSQRIASMDITALRNAYGRQLGSFYIEAPMKGIEGNIPMTFIRAPYIKEVWGDAEVLAERKRPWQTTYRDYGSGHAINCSGIKPAGSGINSCKTGQPNIDFYRY